MKILVADDQPTILRTVAEYLREMGHEPLLAKTGTEVIQIARLEHPPVLLLDGLMPGLHGFDVARIIRSFTDYSPRIILMTAVYRRAHYVNEARLKAGIDRYLEKPVTREKLIEAITGSYDWYSYVVNDGLMVELEAKAS